MKKSFFIIPSVIGIIILAFYISPTFQRSQCFERNDIYSINIPCDFICLEKIRNMQESLLKKDSAILNTGMNANELKKLKRTADYIYLSDEENTGLQYQHYLSYKEILSENFDLNKADFVLQIKKSTPFLSYHIDKNIFNNISEENFLLFGNLINSLYVKPKTHEGEVIKNNSPVFLPMKIESMPFSGEAVVAKNITELTNDEAKIIKHTFFFFKNKNQIIFEFNYRTNKDNEKERNDLVKSIMDSLILNEEYKGVASVKKPDSAP